jgi:hypothetical protein
MTALPSWLMPLLGSLLVLLIVTVAKLAADVSGIKEARAVTCKEHGEKLKENGDGIKAINEAMTAMSKQVDRLVWRQEQDDARAADSLHSPTHRERDVLLVGLMSGTLSIPEIERLIVLLRDAYINGGLKPEEKFFATQLLSRAEWELLDRRRKTND